MAQASLLGKEEDNMAASVSSLSYLHTSRFMLVCFVPLLLQGQVDTITDTIAGHEEQNG
jgi:hypothetical protein